MWWSIIGLWEGCTQPLWFLCFCDCVDRVAPEFWGYLAWKWWVICVSCIMTNWTLSREVNLETNQARGKAAELKQRRQMQAEKNREKTRLAYLKKQVEKLKSAKGDQKETVLSQSNVKETPSWNIQLTSNFLMLIATSGCFLSSCSCALTGDHGGVEASAYVKISNRKQGARNLYPGLKFSGLYLL